MAPSCPAVSDVVRRLVDTPVFYLSVADFKLYPATSFTGEYKTGA